MTSSPVWSLNLSSLELPRSFHLLSLIEFNLMCAQCNMQPKIQKVPSAYLHPLQYSACVTSWLKLPQQFLISSPTRQQFFLFFFCSSSAMIQKVLANRKQGNHTLISVFLPYMSHSYVMFSNFWKQLSFLLPSFQQQKGMFGSNYFNVDRIWTCKPFK